MNKFKKLNAKINRNSMKILKEVCFIGLVHYAVG